MSRRAASARLFVAVDPPEQVAALLAAWARTAARERRSAGGSQQQTLRVLDPELLHVTVCFLGNVPVQEIPSLTDELAACDRPTVRLSVGAPLWLPPRRPRALAVELHDEGEALARIHAQVVARLEPVEELSHAPSGPTGARAKPRRFRPHITVARMRADGSSRRRGGGREQALPPTPALSFAPAELVLYRSWLSPEGASYEALATFQIGDSP
ncbi:MAG: RNA 2',3'-cyclic phosphodiesterase [Solirubrobacteraceae bacterium]